jgi:hypothetical protein
MKVPKTVSSALTPSKSTIVYCCTLVLLCAVSYSLVDTIPTRSITISRMHDTNVGFLDSPRFITNSLRPCSSCRCYPGYDNRTTDGWKHPLGYSFDSSGVVTLHSVGVKGVHQDIIGTFESRTEGKWRNELDEWIVNPSNR